jgi:hypothetical protein
MPDTWNDLYRTARVLENRFYFAENRVLVDELNRLKQEEETVGALAKVSDIADLAVLKELVRLGVRPETIAALCLVPVIEVAWADGSIDARELEAFVKGAEKNGSETSLRIIQAWLRKKPDDALLQAWRHYVTGLRGIMEKEVHTQLCRDIMKHATDVARASGGFLGLIDPVSPSEYRKLDELQVFFLDTPPRAGTNSQD